MSELTFTKTFLSTLDSRPIKLRGDHVSDPEQIGLRVPYTLPRLSAPHPAMPKKLKSASAPGSSKSITVRLKSARNPALEFTMPNVPLSTTSVQDVRDAVRPRVTDAHGEPISLEKIKILYKRKPVAGAEKTLAEVLADEPTILTGGKEVEIGIMILGGAQAVEPNATQPDMPGKSVDSLPKAAVGPSSGEELHTVRFWDDLQGFLAQRLKDGDEANRLRSLFEDAWKSKE